ncbi:MAG: DsrE family protein [Deltaproteobacteria bacterium]|nr:DsrE family protein [Deltaproteobacteria bacterium]
MTKTVIFAFRGDPMCFVHVLLHGLEMAAKGMGGEIIIEGDAVKLVSEMAKPGHFLHQLYVKAKTQGLILGACRACSTKLGVAQAVAAENVALIGEMSGHPSMSAYLEKGFNVITF